MKTRTRRAPRGQAMVEAALGMLVFITVLIVGIHLSEVSFLSLKVQEAANFGIWDATAYKMHDTFSNNWTLWTGAVAQADAAAKQAYGDFNGLTGGGGATVTQVFTQADPMVISCQQSSAISVTPLMGRTASIYPSGSSAVQCTAQAALRGFRVPQSFLDSGSSGGIFQAPHWKAADLQVCATGRAAGGACNGVTLLLDDWGFSGPDERKNCYMLDAYACENIGYYNMVKAVFDQNPFPGNASTQLSQLVAGFAFANENYYWMSFAGSDSKYGPFTDYTGLSHNNNGLWETTPFTDTPGGDYLSSYNMRTHCFLGLPC